jgi:acyl dehydratase
VDWRKVLHAGQSVQMHRPLCAEGSVVSRARVEDVLWQEDRRRAKISIQRDLYDSISKNPVATLRSILFVGMDAAYGSKAARASAGMSPGPTRSPDHTCEIRLANNLALLYRLNGDYNPLHADREAAHISGFSRPILHGLCTYGAVGRALIRELCGNNAGSMKRLTVRFAGHVFPGEKLRVEIWRDGHHKAKFQARCVERNSLVVDQGEVEFVTA